MSSMKSASGKGSRPQASPKIPVQKFPGTLKAADHASSSNSKGKSSASSSAAGRKRNPSPKNGKKGGSSTSSGGHKGLYLTNLRDFVSVQRKNARSSYPDSMGALLTPFSLPDGPILEVLFTRHAEQAEEFMRHHGWVNDSSENGQGTRQSPKLSPKARAKTSSSGIASTSSSSGSKYKFFGLDFETRPQFVKNQPQNKTALLQLGGRSAYNGVSNPYYVFPDVASQKQNATPGFPSSRQNKAVGKKAHFSIGSAHYVVLIWDIHQAKSIPKGLRNLLDLDSACFFGMGLKNDLQKMVKDFSSGSGEVGRPPKNAVDLISAWSQHRQLQGGLTGLANRIFQEHCSIEDYEIPKNKKMSLSNWQKRPLEKGQLTYAALDAFCSCAVAEHFASQHGDVKKEWFMAVKN